MEHAMKAGVEVGETLGSLGREKLEGEVVEGLRKVGEKSRQFIIHARNWKNAAGS